MYIVATVLRLEQPIGMFEYRILDRSQESLTYLLKALPKTSTAPVSLESEGF